MPPKITALSGRLTVRSRLNLAMNDLTGERIDYSPHEIRALLTLINA